MRHRLIGNEITRNAYGLMMRYAAAENLDEKPVFEITEKPAMTKEQHEQLGQKDPGMPAPDPISLDTINPETSGPTIRFTDGAPTIGRIVHYRLTKEDAERTNQRRIDAVVNAERMRTERPGFQAHVGKLLRGGDVVPMMIVAAQRPGLVNGQAILDGNDSLWVMAARLGDGPGEWFWPPRA